MGVVGSSLGTPDKNRPQWTSIARQTIRTTQRTAGSTKILAGSAQVVPYVLDEYCWAGAY